MDKEQLDDVMKNLFKKREDNTVQRCAEQLDIEKEFQEVWEYALKRFRFGALEYGEWNPNTDERDILEEIKEEMGDVVIYSGMLMIKINRAIKLLEKKGLR